MGLFLFVGVSGLLLLGEWMESRFRRDESNSFALIYAEPNIDFFFVGSSQFYFAVNPWVVYEEFGLNPFGITSSGQKFDSAYYLLENALKIHDPRVVVIDVYWRLLEQDFDFGQADFNLSRIVDDEVARDFYEQGFPLSAKLRYSIKLLRYRDSLYTQGEALMNRMVERRGLRPVEREEPGRQLDGPPPGNPEDPEESDEGPLGDTAVEFNRNRGFRFSDNVVSEIELTKDNKFANYYFRGFASRQQAYLVRILDRCREEGVTAVMVSTPVPEESLSHVEEYGEIHGRLQRIAEEHGAILIDFNSLPDSRRIFSREHFQDDNHLNTAGSVLFTRELIRLLNQRGIL